jgi:UDP-glucose 4-epimerase
VRCFVTGATGFVGSHLVRLLLQRGNEVSILIRPNSNQWRIADILSAVRVIRGDLAAVKQVSDEIQSFKPDVVFHLAWHGGNSYKYQNHPSQIFENLYGSLELVQIAKEAGSQRWLGLGTSVEYGKYEIPITENLRPMPDTLYGISKYCTCLSAEKLSQLYGIDFIWFRPFWLYGPYDDPLRMLPWVILALLQGERPALTLGEQRWDYLYVEDAVEAIWRAATTPQAQGIFNLGSGETHSIRSIAERIRDLIDPSLPLGFGEVPYRPDQIMHLQADISRLKQATGWSPNVDLDEGLRRTVEWLRENKGHYDECQS